MGVELSHKTSWRNMLHRGNEGKKLRNLQLADATRDMNVVFTHTVFVDLEQTGY